MGTVAARVRLDILVVAGVATLVPGLVASLTAAGHRVRVVRNDARALAALGDDWPDLLLAERGADGPSGLGAVTILAEHGVPVLPPDRVVAALELGGAEFLLTPFALDRI